MKGRSALVTGGTGALGRYVVQRLQEEGVSVHVPWIDDEEVEALQEFLGQDARGLHLHSTDVTDAEAVEGLFRRVEASEGAGADILCNLVGGFAFAPVEETEAELWDAMMAVNARSAFLASRAALPSMRDKGWGRIVTVCAYPALERGARGLSAYSASKAAVLNLTYTLSRETVGEGVTVNAVVPKIIDTPENRKAMPDQDFSTWVSPREIAEVIAFVVSDAAPSLTGAALTLTRD